MIPLIHFFPNQNISVDNAFSTIQIIHQIITKLNDVIDYTNNLDLSANNYTDEEINKLNASLTKAINDLDIKLSNLIRGNVTNINDLNIKFSSELTQVNSELDKVNTDLTNLSALTNANYQSLLLMINNLNTLIDEFNYFDEPKIYSPLSGKKINIQNAINELFNLHLIDTSNCTVKYIKDMFDNLGTIDTYDIKTTTKFSVLNDILDGTSPQYLNLATNLGNTTISFPLHTNLKNAYNYSLYDIILIVSKSLSNLNKKSVGENAQTITERLRAIEGYGYTPFLPLNTAW